MGRTSWGAVEYRLADLRLSLAARRFSLALDDMVRKYRPDQPRMPKGSPEGGRWVFEGIAQSEQRIRVALSAVLSTQRVGLGDNGLVRHCIYVDALGRQFTREIDASKFCPPTIVPPPYCGAL